MQVLFINGRIMWNLAHQRLTVTDATAKVTSITEMIIFHIILHPAVHIYDFHIFITSSSSFHGIITNQFNDLLPVGSTGRALHRYRRGHGSVSRANLNFFSGFLFATAKVASITVMIIFHISHRTVCSKEVTTFFRINKKKARTGKHSV